MKLTVTCYPWKIFVATDEVRTGVKCCGLESLFSDFVGLLRSFSCKERYSEVIHNAK